MMSTSHFKPVLLEITAADDATEIFLIDANLVRIASDVGQLEKNVAPGIYKVRFRSGASQHDKLIEVSGVDEHVNVQGPPILFRTSAPIDMTLSTHEYQSGPAQASSNNINRMFGVGGELFVFLREENEEQSFFARGLTIHSLDGTELISIESGDVDIQSRWAAINLSIDPGTYSIRAASDQIGTYEIFVTVSQDWQTQVFLVMDEFWYENISFRIPSLRSASVLMSRLGLGFNPYSETVRLSELARQALEQGRSVISTQIMNKLLHEKFEDPMLGIIAAQLLMQRHRPNWELLRTVTNNLLNILGDHPDVQALLIAMKNQTNIDVDSINNPPLMRKSWDNIVRASRRRANIVQPNSPNALIANEVVTGGPWLIHRVNEESQSYQKENISIAESMRVVEKFITFEPEYFTEIIEQTNSSKENLSGLERSVLSAVMSYAQTQNMEIDDNETSVQVKARQMFGDLSAPTYSIANAVISLADKIKLD